jgi:NADPH:quinone reductase-like Zn-dependent oxidoreductase
VKAATFDRFGDPPDVLEVKDAPAPQPGPGQVRLRMLASPINPSDLMTVRGVYGFKPNLPAIPGFEGTGVVEAAGSGLLGRFLVGKRVAAVSASGGFWAEQAIIDARKAIPVSGKLSDEQAAGFFVNPATAYLMTRSVLKVPGGAWLVQSAAGSAVGRMVIALGRRYGFQTLNLVRRRTQADRLNAEGAEALATEDSDWEGRAAQLLGPTGASFALDPVGGAVGTAMLKMLGRNGRFLTYGSLSFEDVAFEPRRLITQGIRIETFALARHMEGLGLPSKLGLVRTLGRLVGDGTLAQKIGATFPLGRIADAARAAEEPGRDGKVIVKIA